MKIKVISLAAITATVAVAAVLIFKVLDIRNLLSRFIQAEKVAIVELFQFNNSESLKNWEEKVFHQSVDYKVQSSEGGSYVQARSRGTCSAMYHKVNIDVTSRPVLSWKWQVFNLPEKSGKEDLLNKEEDDFAARVYIIFPELFFANSKALEYVWANELDVGTISSSPYSKNIKLIVAESGIDPNKSGLVKEERDIYEDYVRAFGKRPKMKMGAIAFMCDSDSTMTSAEAAFDDIKIFYKEDK